MAIRIRPAAHAEIEQAADVLEDAIGWAAERGFESWTPGSFRDPGAWGKGRLREAFDAGGLFLIERSGAIVGTLSLLPDDELFWPGAAPNGLYLHRFAIRRGTSGTGVGDAALAWCEEETRRRRRRFLRLDCLAANPGIRRYYERAGFEHRGDRVVNGMEFGLYEKDVGRS